MKRFTLLLLIAFSVCYANNPQNKAIESMQDSIKALNVRVGELIEKQNKISKFQREITDSISVISVKAIEKSQAYYDSAFSRIESSYSNFLFKLSIAVALLAGITVIAVAINFISARGAKEEFENKIKTTRNDVVMEIGRLCLETSEQQFVIAGFNIKENKLSDSESKPSVNANEVQFYIYTHFLNLCSYYSFFARYNIELDKEHLKELEHRVELIKYYERMIIIINDNDRLVELSAAFFAAFSNFMEYCKDTKKQKHFQKAKEIWDKLNVIFGEDFIKKAIKDFNKG